MKRNKKKVLSGVTAVCCAGAVLVAGTFAWQAVSSAMNAFSDTLSEEGKNPGANLHDDFDSLTGEKKIYVENTGDTDVYVRVSLAELFAEGVSEQPAGGTWSTHMPANGDVADCGGGFQDAYEGAFTWNLGSTEVYNYQSIVGSAAWNASEVAGDVEATRKGRDNLVGDALGSAQSGSTIVNLKDAVTADKVAPSAQVIAMKAYKEMSAANKSDFAGWVYDVDGYAYWSQPLAAGASTGLLLNGVTMPEAGTETYYYAINAVMEYVDTADLGAWTHEGSDGKREIILNEKGQMASHTKEKGAEIVAGSQAGQTTTEASTDASEMLIDVSKSSLTAEGATTNLTTGESAPAPTVKDGNGKEVKVTWTSSDKSIVSVDEKTGKITGVKEGGPVTITGTSSTGGTVTYQVNVTDPLPVDKDLTAVAPPNDMNLGDKEEAPVVKDEDNNEVEIVEWESSNPEVATVDPETGEITAVGPGTTTITGKDAEDNEVSFDVTVTDVLNASPANVSVIAGGTADIPKITDVNQNEIPAGDLTWTSSDSSKATIDLESGKINGIANTDKDVTLTGTDDKGNKVEITVSVGKSAQNKLDEVVIDEPYMSLENEEEGLLIGDDGGDGWGNFVIVPYYSNNWEDNAIDWGDYSKNYGVVPVSKLFKLGADASNVTFSATDERVVKIEDGNIYLWYLPDHKEFIAAGGNDGYHPEVSVIATYTDPETGEKASKEVKIALFYMGTIAYSNK